MVTRDDLLTILETELGVDTADIADDTLLFSSGVVDSFALVTLISEVEKRAGIRIAPDDVTLDNLDSIDRILSFVARVRA
jgi:acyl carrier protein